MIRPSAVLGLLFVLSTLFVFYGVGVGQPNGPPFDTDDIADDSAALIGEQVETSGTVVETNPVVIEAEIDDGRTIKLTIENVPTVEPGETLLVTGELVDERIIGANTERTVVRKPWEVTYMYTISIIGAILVAARIANQWRFRPQEFVFEPRERTLFDRYVRGRSGRHDPGDEYDG
ncbi:hypothetical protein [Halovenus aranensis]|uniref:hypothetical protein n=1 Tax=Halovenus aranensis TaxID=890420 RepID=UPI00117B3049|nr:hypothetical protein [Halovenus aranensis]